MPTVSCLATNTKRSEILKPLAAHNAILEVGPHDKLRYIESVTFQFPHSHFLPRLSRRLDWPRRRSCVLALRFWPLQGSNTGKCAENSQWVYKRFPGSPSGTRPPARQGVPRKIFLHALWWRHVCVVALNWKQQTQNEMNFPEENGG